MGGQVSLAKNMGDKSREESGLEESDPTKEGAEAEAEELSVSFGYQFRSSVTEHQETESASGETSPGYPHESPLGISSCPRSIGDWSRPKRTSSFSYLSGAALSANATLANTRICNGIIGEEILPGLDSPRTFRRLNSSVSFSRVESSMSSSVSSFSTISGSSLSSQAGILGNEVVHLESVSAPNRIETRSFLHATDVQAAGGAAGEDRVQAVCSEENGWLFCAIYDGFNGRDAADFLAGTLYENIALQLRLLEWRTQQQWQHSPLEDTESTTRAQVPEVHNTTDVSFRQDVLKGLQRALAETESDFMEMVEQEMDERPDLVMVGSCVLVLLLHGHDLYILNLGDSKAVLATSSGSCGSDANKPLCAVQLTENHLVDEDAERERVLAEHPNDPSAIFAGRVKGKVRVTRAFGAGFLKKKKLNNALMGILRVQDLCSPPYISTKPYVTVRTVEKADRFVVIGSDGLFDFFNNEEVVDLIDRFISENPTSDPAKYILEQLLLRAADNSGMTVERLKSIPIGRRRKYHDDVTVIIVSLGTDHRMSSASTAP